MVVSMMDGRLIAGCGSGMRSSGAIAGYIGQKVSSMCCSKSESIPGTFWGPRWVWFEVLGRLLGNSINSEREPAGTSVPWVWALKFMSLAQSKARAIVECRLWSKRYKTRRGGELNASNVSS